MNGEDLFIRQKRKDVQITRTTGGHRLIVNRHKGKRVFATIYMAKVAIFELIENGELERYLRRLYPFTRGGEGTRPAR